MFEFIAFILKILFATFLGALVKFRFNSNSDQKNNDIILSSMLSLFSSSMLGMSLQFPNEILGMVSSASILASIGTTLFLTKNKNIEDKIIYLFASLIGLITGGGLVFQAILFTIFIVLLNRYGNDLLESMSIKEEEIN
ncbi:MAG: hypothetical protein CMG07_01185 [Candidatus Marinimicrobia bacterium]|nr:hypothetical protein [Candidatus Neomarinimicrobiota bacterium]|tara:strand:+ start:176 stop:592 length:417 start_codon:yes stop_codon:yes gene_type:complete